MATPLPDLKVPMFKVQEKNVVFFEVFRKEFGFFFFFNSTSACLLAGSGKEDGCSWGLGITLPCLSVSFPVLSLHPWPHSHQPPVSAGTCVSSVVI